MSGREKCTTCGFVLVWITVPTGNKLVCPRPQCPGHQAGGGR